MRLAGTLDRRDDAERLGDYLLAQGIRCKVEPSGEHWAIWVREEDQVAQAVAEFDAFRNNPNDPRYQAARDQAEAIRREEARREKEYRRSVVRPGENWQASRGPAPATFLLLAISVAATLWTAFGKNDEFAWLIISFRRPDWNDPDTILTQVLQWGQVWRLVTPIFVHMNVIHLLFNMWWFVDFGREIEGRRGTLRFLALVLGAAVVSNLVQYFYTGPGFGGMSGVLYALFGYIWMKSRYEPASGFMIHPQTVFILMLWLVICMTGKIGAVANAAHVAGLVVGLLVGIRRYGWRQLIRSLRN